MYNLDNEFLTKEQLDHYSESAKKHGVPSKYIHANAYPAFNDTYTSIYTKIVIDMQERYHKPIF